jgi:hypothetical protein
VSNERDHDHERGPRASGARAVLALLGAWTVLDLLFNVRYPAPEPPGWYLLPSLDATALLAVAALCARRGARLPRALVVAAAVFVVLVRLFRVGEGVTIRYFNRPLSLALDLPLSSELVRLLDATMPRPLLLLAIAGALAVLAAIAFATARALRAGERALADRPARTAFAAACVVAALASLLAPPSPAGRRAGAFGASMVPRLARETAFALALPRHREVERAAVAAADARLRASPHGLEKLAGADVFLVFMESYGATVIDRPEQRQLLEPTWAAAEADLARHGFAVASGLLESPTYAGRSWLAHETLATGVQTGDRIADELVQRARPVTLARFFHEAGYRTVFAQPANRYRSLSRWLYDFDTVYSGWDFDYRGPSFRWANMPDQYVLDFIHRHEVARRHGPLLAAYALVSSHAPWSDQPPFLDDWGRIGDGAVYASLPIDHYPITWTTLARGGPAYVHSVAYDLRVVVDYATRFVAGEALMIVLGDHQPVAEVTAFSPSHAVPVHVLSRRPDFVVPFLARGYVPGIRPRRTQAPPGMETFLPGLLADFSAARAGRRP